MKKVIREKRAALGKINSHEIQVFAKYFFKSWMRVIWITQGVHHPVLLLQNPNNCSSTLKKTIKNVLLRCWCSSSSWYSCGSSRSQSSSQAGEISSKGDFKNTFVLKNSWAEISLCYTIQQNNSLGNFCDGGSKFVFPCLKWQKHCDESVLYRKASCHQKDCAEQGFRRFNF